MVAILREQGVLAGLLITHSTNSLEEMIVYYATFDKWLNVAALKHKIVLEEGGHRYQHVQGESTSTGGLHEA